MGKNTKIRDKRMEAQEEMPTWVECEKCKAVFLVYKEIAAKGYVCKRCRTEVEKKEEESKNEKGKKSEEVTISEVKLVEMLCKRHKKRIEVPESWLETCDYLCPQCYHKLSAKERKAYRPKRKGKKGIERIKAEKKVSAEAKAAEEKLLVEEKKADGTKGISIDDFKPKYRIHCQKCGEIVPCHYEWYDKSTVLCPQCYCGMSENAIALFHMEHKAEKPPKGMGGEMPKSIESGVRRKTEKEYAQWDRNHVYKENGGRWPDERIKRASVSALQSAVKRGLVSAVRYRIELKRRKKREFYDSLAETKYDLPVIVR